eukprot:g11950.t2
MFNARSETAAEKPSFRRLVGRRHGVVAFTGFYEWKRDEKGERQPYYFYLADGRPLLFAVLYDTWQQGDPGTGSGSGTGNGGGGASRAEIPNNQTEGQAVQQMALLEREVEDEDRGGSLMFSYAVLTTSAAPRLAWLHERMPVILRGPQDAAAWLGCKGAEASMFLKNHSPYSGEDLVWHPVSKQMNQMRYDAEDCSAAIELKKPAQPLPAITSFFQKRGPEPGPSPTLPVTTPTRGGGGGGGGSEGRGAGKGDGDIGENLGDKAATWGAVIAAAGTGAKATAAEVSRSPSVSTPVAKRCSRPGGEGLGGRAAAGGTAAPSPPALSPVIDWSAPSKRARTTVGGNPSPRKGGSKAGAAAAAAATRDKKQPKLTSFFGAPR